MENFETYLATKNINSAKWQKSEPNLWRTMNEMFEQMHPNSFYVQHLFLINKIRRQFPLNETEKKAV